jgi:hypothetical protein
MEQTETFGLSIKSKVSGTWQDSHPYAKVGGTWQRVLKAYTKVSGTWQTSYQWEYVYTYSSGEYTDQDFDNLGLDKTNNVRVIVPSGTIIIASSTSTYAIKTGTGYGGNLIIENRGRILGRGGNGGNGGTSGSGGSAGAAGTAGQSGGNAIHVECPLYVYRIADVLAGGGGGGGGGGSRGSGSEGRLGSAGGTASLTSGGGGGAGSSHSEGVGSAGASGGSVGSSGSGASSGTGSFASGGGGGGAAASWMYNPSNHFTSFSNGP